MSLNNFHLAYGVSSWTQLHALGVTQAELKRALAAGHLRRLRRNWYATSGAHPLVVQAVAAGGVCSCLTALKLLGVWVPPHPKKVHVRARESAHRGGRGERFCKRYGPPQPEYEPVDDLRTALSHAVKCLDEEGIVVVCDSILHQDLLERCDLDELLASAPQRIRRLLDRCNPRAESGTESAARLRLQSMGIKVTVQPTIAGVGRVDLLIGDRLIIELDSEEFHDRSSRQREKDRRRDEEAIRLGYLPVRFSYHRVFYEWPQVKKTVLELVRRGEHLGPVAG